MASYTIVTTRTQEAGLKFSYDTYADKTVYPTQQAWFQFQIGLLVSDPMYLNKQRASTISFQESFKTIPETSQPAAQTEIETVITSHGGTIVPGIPPMPPPPPSVTPAAKAMLTPSPLVPPVPEEAVPVSLPPPEVVPVPPLASQPDEVVPGPATGS